MKRNKVKNLISFLTALAALSSLLCTSAVAKDSDDFFMRGTAKEGEKVVVLGDTFTERLAFERSRYKDGEYFAGNPHSGRPLAKSSETCLCTNCMELVDSHYCYEGCGDSCGTYYVGGDGMAAAWQCYGFACQLGYDIFGVDPYAGWQAGFNLEELVPGDIIRFSWSDKEFNPHVIFVTNIVDATVFYADCNSKGPCRICWDNEIKIDKLYTLLGNFPDKYKDGDGKEQATRVGIYHCLENENERFQPGDVNGDGKITPADLITFIKYSAGADEGLAVMTSSLDANLDARVNAKDYFKIFDYIQNGCPLYYQYWNNYWYYNPGWPSENPDWEMLDK